MLSCREATRRMSEAQERKLAPGERLGLALHLAVCRGCRQFDCQLVTLRRAMQLLGGRD